MFISKKRPFFSMPVLATAPKLPGMDTQNKTGQSSNRLMKQCSVFLRTALTWNDRSGCKQKRCHLTGIDIHRQMTEYFYSVIVLSKKLCTHKQNPSKRCHHFQRWLSLAIITRPRLLIRRNIPVAFIYAYLLQFQIVLLVFVKESVYTYLLFETVVI